MCVEKIYLIVKKTGYDLTTIRFDERISDVSGSISLIYSSLLLFSVLSTYSIALAFTYVIRSVLP